MFAWRKGKVDVHFNEKTSSLPNVVMKPNQMVSYNKSSAKMDLTEVDTSDALAWVGGSLSFFMKQVSWKCRNNWNENLM